MPREHSLILSLAVTFFILLGMIFYILLVDFFNPAFSVSTPAPTIAPVSFSTPLPTSFGTQISILLLAVDSVESSKPRLEGCWVLSFESGVSQYYLLGFSPATIVHVPGAEAPRRLSDVYDLDTQVGRGPVFTREALHLISPGLASPQYEVVFDRTMLAWTIDSLGGLTLNGEGLNGETVLARWDAISADMAAERLAFEGEVLKALLAAVQFQTWTPESLQAYFNLGQQWNPDAEAFLALAEQSLPTLPQAEFIILYAPLQLQVTPTP